MGGDFPGEGLYGSLWGGCRTVILGGEDPEGKLVANDDPNRLGTDETKKIGSKMR